LFFIVLWTSVLHRLTLFALLYTFLRFDQVPLINKHDDNVGYMNACPRDGLMVVGDEIIESAMAWRSRLFEFYPYKKLFTEYFRQGARWTAAPRPAMGDDLYVKVEHSY